MICYIIIGAYQHFPVFGGEMCYFYKKGGKLACRAAFVYVYKNGYANFVILHK